MLDFFDHLHEREKARLALIGGAILFLIQLGLQMSGFTSLPLAIGVWGLAALLFIYWASHFERAKPLYDWINSHWRLVVTLVAIAIIGLFFWGGMQFQYWRSGGASAVYEKLSIDEFRIISHRFNPETKKFGALFGATLMNWSYTDPIFCQSISGSTEIQSRINPDENPVSPLIMLEPRQSKTYNLSTIDDIDLGDGKQRIPGRIKLGIAYGPTPDQMNYVLNYEGEIQLIPQITPQGAIVSIQSAVIMKRYGHAKIQK